ncbi:MAG: adenylyltransferase/cytidyltransferase family protein, partial [Atopobiaceae bacterium]|nr:adenylyltransferase/cytidyltransferase family protein [Atopobiaceae bacterium]
MKKVITYGTYDLLHQGHINLLRRAKELGDYLIVGVTSDAYDRERGKLNVQQSTIERVDAVRATNLADLVIVEEYEGQKIADIQRYGVDVFTVGSDWVGKFDYLNDYCKVVYLSRTEGISSTELRERRQGVVHLGIAGGDSIANRFVGETPFVSGIECSAVWNPTGAIPESYRSLSRCKQVQSLEDLARCSDAICVFLPPEQRYQTIMYALDHGCHVMSETPLFLTQEQAHEAFRLAEEKTLVLFESIKTLYFPAFEHLLLLAKSGQIGEIRDIEVSCSQIPSSATGTMSVYDSALLDWGTDALMPITKLLGSDPSEVHVYSQRHGDAAYFTRGLMCFPNATATFSVGRGIKTEGDLVITGTRGYIYVPSPWWLTDYFEIRHEDLRSTRKYFWNYEGEGFRYEILAFLQELDDSRGDSLAQSPKDVLAQTQIIEQALAIWEDSCDSS